MEPSQVALPSVGSLTGATGVAQFPDRVDMDCVLEHPAVKPDPQPIFSTLPPHLVALMASGDQERLGIDLATFDPMAAPRDRAMSLPSKSTRPMLPSRLLPHRLYPNEHSNGSSDQSCSSDAHDSGRASSSSGSLASHSSSNRGSLESMNATSPQRQPQKLRCTSPYIPSYMDLSNGPEPCQVCGDAATGYHYRAMTCEGCKGFFRRVVQKQLNLRCNKEGACPVGRYTRNHCQACRFAKCVSVGMSTNIVLNSEQRAARRKLIELNREVRRGGSTTKSRSPRQFKSTDYLDVVDQAATINSAEVSPDSSHSELNENSAASAPGTPDSGSFSQRCESGGGLSAIDHVSIDIIKRAYSSSPKQGSAADQNGSLAPAIARVVDFAKNVPGFRALLLDDQIALLKNATVEVLCLHATSNYDPRTESLRLRSRSVTRAEITENAQLSSIVLPLIEFAAGFARLDLDECEIALLAAVLLAQTDRPGIKCQEAVERLQDSMLGLFKRYISQKRPAQPIHWAKVLMKLNDIRSLAMGYSKIMPDDILTSGGSSAMQPVFVELFSMG